MNIGYYERLVTFVSCNLLPSKEYVSVEITNYTRRGFLKDLLPYSKGVLGERWFIKPKDKSSRFRVIN